MLDLPGLLPPVSLVLQATKNAKFLSHFHYKPRVNFIYCSEAQLAKMQGILTFATCISLHKYDSTSGESLASSSYDSQTK